MGCRYAYHSHYTHFAPDPSVALFHVQSICYTLSRPFHPLHPYDAQYIRDTNTDASSIIFQGGVASAAYVCRRTASHCSFQTILWRRFALGSTLQNIAWSGRPDPPATGTHQSDSRVVTAPWRRPCTNDINLPQSCLSSNPPRDRLSNFEYSATKTDGANTKQRIFGQLSTRSFFPSSPFLALLSLVLVVE